jgi:hypothetical protein
MTDPAPDRPAESPESAAPATPDDFARQAEAPSRNFLVELGSEFLQFLKEEKKWWLIPIIVSLGLIALLALLLHSPAAPFIYPLF